eukprot:2037313-Rhodomonas_salina.1
MIIGPLDVLVNFAVSNSYWYPVLSQFCTQLSDPAAVQFEPAGRCILNNVAGRCPPCSLALESRKLPT